MGVAVLKSIVLESSRIQMREPAQVQWKRNRWTWVR
jgi:hypothetical protein